jgi:exopolysaccharide biosynthesis polyprenyl glycosylphosphotransferase
MRAETSQLGDGHQAVPSRALLARSLESMPRGETAYSSGSGISTGSSEADARFDSTVPDPFPPYKSVGEPGSRNFGDWGRRYVARLVALDAVMAMIAVLTASIAFPRLVDFAPGKLTILVIGSAVAWPIVVASSRGYERTSIGVGDDEMRAVLRAMVLAIAAGAVPSAVTGNPGLVNVCVFATPIASFASIITRYGARKHLHSKQRAGLNLRRIIVVGSAYAVAELASAVAREPHCGMSVIGVCVPGSEADRAREAGLAVIGDPNEIPHLVKPYGADAVAVTGGDSTRHNYLRELSWGLEGMGVELLVHPGLIEVAGPRMHIRPHVGLPLLHVEQPDFTGWRRFIKRATDLLLTGLGLIVISPLLAVIALTIRLHDGGPVIFRQTRVGLDGATFTMYKFRSMHVNAEAKLATLRTQNPGMGTLFKLADDPRVTPVGRFLRRFSLDELPQLLNVLAGHMSLVGPRPPLQSEVDAYEDHARRRQLVTPGLTGQWQVSGRSLLSWEETVRLDLRYVENWTLTLDLLILWKTFFAVLARRGAF